MKQGEHSVKSIGEEAAIALAQTRWWAGKGCREIAEFQLLTKELCCPFDIFHRALEVALKRPVWAHELALNHGGLIKELFGEREKPTIGDILNLIPEGKRIVLVH